MFQIYYCEIKYKDKILHFVSIPSVFVISPITDQCQLNFFITLASTGRSLRQFLVHFHMLIHGDYIT